MRWRGPIIYSGSFVEMKKLASFSIATETILFEVGANFGFVVIIEKMLVSKFLISVSKSTLA